jgi:hypothetical protein
MVVLREVSRVGAEAEAAKMIADTHAVIETALTKEAAETVISTEEMVVLAPVPGAQIGTTVLVEIAEIEMN